MKVTCSLGDTIIVTLFIAMTFLPGCRQKSRQPVEVGRDHKVYIYRNEYENDLLVRTLVLSYPPGIDLDEDFIPAVELLDRFGKEEEEYIYKYENGELVEIEEYELVKETFMENRNLWRSTKYIPGVSEEYRTNRSYRLREYDKDGNLIKHIYRYNPFKYDEMLPEEQHTIEYIGYDAYGRKYQTLIVDSISMERRTERYFYDSIPVDAVVAPGTDIILSRNLLAGDTIITIRELNGWPDAIYKTLDRGDYYLELVYDPNMELDMSTEILRQGNDSIKIIVQPDFKAVDSTYYSNGLEMKWVLTSPEHTTTEINQYDDHGNLSRQERIVVFYEL